MGRQPLPIGSSGNIKTTQLEPKVWLARCRYRDPDGITRQVKRIGRSKSAAENNLRKALTERKRTAGTTITGESRLADASAKWFAQRRAEVDGGDLAPTTLAVYESAWSLYVEPALGQVRLREFTVASCEDWIVNLRQRKGASATKSGRTVLSGILGYAARMGAIQANPVRDLSRIPGGKKKPVRALTAAERRAWLSWMEDHDPLREQVAAAKRSGNKAALDEAETRLLTAEKAARWDIPDLTRFMLATGCRVGEALALSWDEVDFDEATVDIRYRLVPVKGEGLRRVQGAKSAAGERVLQLPRWCVDMLMRRRVDPMSGYPVFPDGLGGWRWPANVLKVLRQARDDAGFGWVTSHVFRKTCLTVLDEAGLTPRMLADVAGHSDPSMTQRVYMARKVASEAAAEALEDLL